MLGQLRAEPAPVFLCSAGDFYGGGNEFNEPKDHFVARMMGYLQYDAIAVGELDLSFGLMKLVEDYEAHDLKLTCANLFWKELPRKPKKTRQAKRGYRPNRTLKPETVFPTYRIVSRDGIKIGFVGILSPRTKVRPAMPGEPARVEALTYVIEDPLPIVKTLVPKVKKKCDVLVLLAHMDWSELEDLLPDLQDVDIAVLGHHSNTRATSEPYLVGTVPVYIAAYQGQHLGRLWVTLDPKKRIADARNTIFMLDKTVEDDAIVADFIVEFEHEYRQAQKELYAKSQVQGGKGTSQSGRTYLGVGKCMRCHEEEFNIYVETRHAKAHATLSSFLMHRDSNCIGCHATGYGQPGGYSGTRALGSMVDLVDVQCEACHGPGDEHKRDGSYAKRAVESCAVCHTEEQDPTFNYAEAWDHIAH